MAVVVIGGHSRNVGKTSVVAGIIAALPEANWTAAKITQFGHGVCSVTTEPCDCALNESEHSWSLDEESDHSGKSDTSRFLAAGAKRVLWVRTKQGMLAEAMPALRVALEAAENVILESNSVLRFLRPDVYFSVLDFENPDFKDSAREFLDRADGIILHAKPANATPKWDRVSLKLIEGKPVFAITPPDYVTPGIAAFVRDRIPSLRAAQKR
jgi:molybdopterin-guanine dinucleotide biosynthesis protein